MEHKKNKFDSREKRNRYRLRHTARGRKIRLCYTRSNKYLSLQAIDSNTNNTLISVSTSSQEYFGEFKSRKGTESASKLGSVMADLLKNITIENDSLSLGQVYFDRGAFRYHGIVKVCADSLRNNGLEF